MNEDLKLLLGIAMAASLFVVIVGLELGVVSVALRYVAHLTWRQAGVSAVVATVVETILFVVKDKWTL